MTGGESTVSVRVLIADDQPRVRRSLRALLTAMRWSTPGSHARGDPASVLPAGALAVEIVGEAENGQEALEQVRTLVPDVVVLDLHAQPEYGVELRADGLATIEAIKNGWPAIRIVVFTLFATDRASVLSAGADAFLLKGCPTHELVEAILYQVPSAPGPD